MQILIVLAAAAAAVFQTSTPTLRARATRSDPVMVRAVIDGDTIDVTAVGRVRLLGIDAPEIGRGFDTSAPFGREALLEMLDLGQSGIQKLIELQKQAVGHILQ